MNFPDIYSWSIDDKIILVVEIFGSPLKPHFLKSYGKQDGTFVRVGATNKKADNEFIEELERQKRNISFDEDIFYDAQVSEKSIENLCQILNSKLKRDISKSDLLNLKFIEES